MIASNGQNGVGDRQSELEWWRSGCFWMAIFAEHAMRHLVTEGHVAGWQNRGRKGHSALTKLLALALRAKNRR